MAEYYTAFCFIIFKGCHSLLVHNCLSGSHQLCACARRRGRWRGRMGKQDLLQVRLAQGDAIGASSFLRHPPANVDLGRDADNRQP